MSLRFAVVHEHENDFTIATELADRFFVEAIDWMDEDQLAHQRKWIAETHESRRLTWTGIKKLAGEANLKAHGHFNGEPGHPDAFAARRAILYLMREMADLAAIVLIRDQDDQPRRRDGLEQARKQHGGIPIVVGLAVVERECWVLSGFDPTTEAETIRLAAAIEQLGYDPRLHSHRFTACKDNFARHSAKRLLNHLVGGDWHRQRRCWQEATLSLLRTRGEQNGLSEYLHEVRQHLAPLLGHVSADS